MEEEWLLDEAFHFHVAKGRVKRGRYTDPYAIAGAMDGEWENTKERERRKKASGTYIHRAQH